MDIFSYLLGKQAGGGSNLQTKNVTITENKTTNITPDEGYDGMSSVSVTTNVSGGNVVYDGTKLPATMSGMRVTYANFVKGIIEVNNVDLSNHISLYQFFYQATNLTTCTDVVTTGVQQFDDMFNECSNLQNVGVLDTSSATSMNNMFRGCLNLTDKSLDNILLTCINTTSAYTLNKNLTSIGWTNPMQSKYPKSKIQSLPHYQDFIDAGWTTGY